FDPDDMLDLLDRLIDLAEADGFQGLRGTGGSSRPVPDDLWPTLLGYEARVNERFARRPFTALCRFRADHVSPTRAQDLLRPPPIALVRGAVCTTPFSEPPEVGGDSRARLDWQMHQVRAYNRRHLQHDRSECDLVALVREAATHQAALL